METVSLNSKTMHYPNILDNTVWEKKIDIALLIRCAETLETKGELRPRTLRF